MYLKPNENRRSFRDVRAHLTQVCSARHATLLLKNRQPKAIIVPIKLQRLWMPGPKDKGIAKAKRDFAAILLELHPN